MQLDLQNSDNLGAQSPAKESVRIAAFDEHGDHQVDDLQVDNISYFPKGQAHTIQGMGSFSEWQAPLGSWANHLPRT